MPGNVLIVEDEVELAEAMAWALRRHDISSTLVHTGAEALTLLGRSPRPDLVLLDLLLPDMPGEEIARTLRADPQTARLPIVMVSARDGEMDRVVGLAIGADDYVTKPFSTRELALRVRAILRRVGEGSVAPRPTRVGPLRADPDLRQAWVDEQPLDLTALELRLLTDLMARQGQVVTREELLGEVWGATADEVTLRAVDARIKALRRKLGAAADLLETVRGVGYRLGAPP